MPMNSVFMTEYMDTRCPAKFEESSAKIGIQKRACHRAGVDVSGSACETVSLYWKIAWTSAHVVSPRQLVRRILNDYRRCEILNAIGTSPLGADVARLLEAVFV